jgi:glycerol-3-phosphate dehydrogenase
VAHPFTGDPAVVTAPAADIVYLCTAANRYFRQQIQPVDVIRIISGANMVLARSGDRAGMAGVMRFSTSWRKAPLLTMFGGDVTTARRRAEQAVSRLARFFPMGPRWTATAPLPGGDFAWDQFNAQVEAARERWRFLGKPEAQRLVSAYGSRLTNVLGEAKVRDDLGQSFGPELTEAELRHLMTREWARFPDDVLWRRSKLGLTMPPDAQEALAAFMAKATATYSPPGILEGSRAL